MTSDKRANTFVTKKSVTKFIFDGSVIQIIKRNMWEKTNEPWHGISNNLVCATSKASDQPAHMRSLIRAFASRLNIL